MGFTIGSLFEASLLFINAIAILNEDRFLVKGTLLTVQFNTYCVSNKHAPKHCKIVLKELKDLKPVMLLE